MMMAAGLVAGTALPQAPAWAQSKARTVSAADWAKIKEAARKEG